MDALEQTYRRNAGSVQSRRTRSALRRDAAIDLGVFTASAWAAFQFRWELKDLMWGLWLSSLVVGYSLILWGTWWSAGWNKKVAGMPTSPILKGIVYIGVALAVMLQAAFFTIHFGGFHLGHAAFLNNFFPLGPATNGQGPFDFLVYLPRAVAMGWPLVVGSAVSSRAAFEKARTVFNPMTAYINVLRMHLMIFVLAGARIAGLDNRWLYVFVLFVYFFPFRAVRDLVVPGRAEP